MAVAGENEVLKVGPLEVYVDEELARVNGRAITLSGRTFALLAALARHPGEVVARDVLYREAWGKPLQPGDRSVDVSMVKLRSVLEHVCAGWQLIHTHHRHGYRLDPQLRSRRSPRDAGGDANAVIAEMRGTRVIVGPVAVIAPELLVIVDDTRLWLTAREMNVLVLLATNAGRVLSREAIFDAIWKRPLDSRDRSVDVAIVDLRAKLHGAAPRWEFIHTHFRRGYRFEPLIRPRQRRDGSGTTRRGSGTSTRSL